MGEALQMQSSLSRSLTETLQINTQPPSHTPWPEIWPAEDDMIILRVLQDSQPATTPDHL